MAGARKILGDHPSFPKGVSPLEHRAKAGPEELVGPFKTAMPGHGFRDKVGEKWTARNCPRVSVLREDGFENRDRAWVFRSFMQMQEGEGVDRLTEDRTFCSAVDVVDVGAAIFVPRLFAQVRTQALDPRGKISPRRIVAYFGGQAEHGVQRLEVEEIEGDAIRGSRRFAAAPVDEGPARNIGEQPGIILVGGEPADTEKEIGPPFPDHFMIAGQPMIFPERRNPVQAE